MQLQMTHVNSYDDTCAMDVRQRCSPYVHAALAGYAVGTVKTPNYVSPYLAVPAHSYTQRIGM